MAKKVQLTVSEELYEQFKKESEKLNIKIAPYLMMLISESRTVREKQSDLLFKNYTAKEEAVK